MRFVTCLKSLASLCFFHPRGGEAGETLFFSPRGCKRKWGFTMVEILVVATIIGVLASIGVASYGAATKKSRDGKRKGDLEQIRSALEMCRADTGAYPSSVSPGGSLSCGGTTYLNPVPHDPMCPGGTCKTGFSNYSYSGGGSSYTISTTLEIGGSYSKSNP